jgi:hypothetical protein
MKFNWDGSFLGNVNDEIIQRSEENGLKIVKFKNGSVGYITCYKDNIPLIADELKPLFNLKKIGRHSCRIGGRKYILHKISRSIRHEFPFSDNISLCKYINEDTIEDVRRAMIFRYIIGFIKNIESSLWIRIRSNNEVYVTSHYENIINYDRCTLKDKIVKKIFDNWDVVDTTLKNMIIKEDKMKDLIKLRWKISETINRVDNNYVYLTNAIIRRIDELT